MNPNIASSSDSTFQQPVVILPDNKPIRFPHIPARNTFPPGASTRIQKAGSTHRVDANHPRPGKTVSEIPGIRTRESLLAEATDDHVLPEPATTVQDDETSRRQSQELLSMSGQMRRRLMDFGNLLSYRVQDPRVERAFETVCQSFSQLQSVIERNNQ